jgi:hypothetical protein
VVEGGGEEEVRRATTTGRPLGGTGFYARLERLLKRSLFRRKAGRRRKTCIRSE